jgi:deazaflavin-dependent oxidoreductase (nitroreductase family)
MERGKAKKMWSKFNKVSKPFAGIAPWWVLLETTGRKSGQPRQVPLARGPVDGNVAWLIAVHGRHSDLGRNIDANPLVRLRIGGHWRTGAAELLPMDDAVVRRFNAYARQGPEIFGLDPLLLRITLDPR